MGGALRLEIVTPDGCSFGADGVERVVFRRRERQHEQGSEVAILPGHGPMLVRVPCTPLRYRRGGETYHLAVAGGFAEIRGSRVLVVTPRFEEVGPDSGDARARASALAGRWLLEYEDFLAAMTGL